MKQQGNGQELLEVPTHMATRVHPENQPSSNGMPWWVWLILLLVAAAGISLLFPSVQQKLHLTAKPVVPKPRPIPVSVDVAVKKNVDIYIGGLGNVVPLQTINVKSRVDGAITAINFEEGAIVDAGKTIIEIDHGPYQAALQMAKAQQEKDQASLDGAQNDLDRYQKMPENSVPKQQIDDQVALVNQDKAAVAVDAANVKTAQLNLDYSFITAPVAGRIGIRQVDLGNYVQASAGATLVTITQLQPISVIIKLPGQYITSVMNKWQDALKNKQKVDVNVLTADKTKQVAAGYVEAVDNQIDTASGCFQVRARFSNDNLALFPQNFVYGKVLIQTLEGAIVIPNAAVQTDPDGKNFVYVVGDEHKVDMRTVQTGDQVADQIVVTDGLKAGETVVTFGLDKLEPGKIVSFGPKKSDKGPASAPSPQTQPAFNNNPDDLNNIYVLHPTTAAGDKEIPLADVGIFHLTSNALIVHHLNAQSSVTTINLNLTPSTQAPNASGH